MSTPKNLPQRRSPRLQEYDYTQEGAYFVTICSQNRLSLFGEVVADGIRLNDAGRMVAHYWSRLPEQFPTLDLDAFVIMPNHVHGILILGGETRADIRRSSLSQHMQWFKTVTTNAYVRGVDEARWDSFPGKLWQRSFHDHIIRNERSLNALREYILSNPARWADDQLNPANPIQS
jgi:REP element-mobilizing transposase RayT